jgi:hypothetical protein
MSRQGRSKKPPVSRSPARRRKPFLTRFFETAREPLMFLVGLMGVVYEFRFHAGPERLGLLALFGAMMGLPVVLGADIWRRKNGDDSAYGNGYEEEL